MRNRRSPSYWKSATAAEGASAGEGLPEKPTRAQGFSFAPERPSDRAQVDRLIDRVFGPGRLVKTAERLREANRFRADLSFCAWSGEALVAAVRLWPIWIGAMHAQFLGPLAVDPEHQGEGGGRALVGHACAAAEQAGETLVLLVGAPRYFTPLGFEPIARDRLTLPGPVDPSRLLWRAFGGLAPAEAKGAVRIRPPVEA